ncbi:MAG: tRNA lysidine(34) synthetase TilS [Gammaproteobacteria bacterium]
MLDLSLIQRASRVWVALSGGCDSIVLLHALCMLRNTGKLHPKLAAVHIHHGLHADADQWQRFCIETCRDWGIHLVCKKTGLAKESANLEAEARRRRYSIWTDLLQADELLALAHHADDQAETVLFRLFRGESLGSLAGIPLKRPLGSGYLVRPLLHRQRAELRDYARKHQLIWVEDTDNSNLERDRNFLRHQIVPALKQRWPAVTDALVRTSEAASRYRALSRSGLEADFLQASDGTSTLSVKALQSLSASRSEGVIALWCEAHQLRPPPLRSLRAQLHDLLFSASDRMPQLCWQEHCRLVSIRRYRQTLYMCLPPSDLPPSFLWPACSQSELQLPHGTLVLRYSEATMANAGSYLSPEYIANLQVRFRTGGEKFQLQGRTGHKSLSKYWQEQGIPPWRRSTIPLLYAADQLVAVAGLGISAEAAVQNQNGGYKLEWHPDG